MYEIPSNYKIEKCTITKDTVLNKSKPEIVINENKQKDLQKKVLKKKSKENSSKETA